MKHAWWYIAIPAQLNTIVNLCYQYLSFSIICGNLTDIIGHATTNAIDGIVQTTKLVILTNVYWMHRIILIIQCNILVKLTNVDLLCV